jgi:hypothetical protein
MATNLDEKKEFESTIKLLEEKAAKIREVGRAEMELNKAIKYGSKIRKDTKRLDDALYQATYNLERRHSSLRDSVEKLGKEKEKQSRYTKLLTVESKKLDKVIATSTKKKDIKKATAMQKKFNDKVKESKNQEKALAGQQKKLSAGGVKTIWASKKLAKIRDDLNKTSDLSIRDEADLNKEYEKRLSLENSAIDAMKELGEIDGSQATRMKKDLLSENKVREAKNNLIQEGSEELKRAQAYKEKIAKLKRTGTPKEISEEIRSKHGDVMGAAGKMVTAKSTKERLAAAKELVQSNEDWKNLKTTMLGTGKASKGLAGTVNLLGMAFQTLGKMNWIALIISAVVAVGKAVNEMDKFIKQYNQSFSKMYGPTVAIKNVRGSMKDFTDAVFDMNRNLKYGLKSEEIMGLFDALSAGGLSLGGVGQRVKGGYNEVIEQSLRMSKDFGVSMEEMGGMISEQMMDLRSSLGDVSDKMRTLAYDASVAGVKSTKFYEAAMAAASGLSFYGNYIDNASARLRDFVKSGSMGLKDAAKETQALTDTFKNMTFEQRVATIQMAGGAGKWRKMFEEKSKAAAGEEQLLKDEVAAMKEKAASITDSAKKEQAYKDIAAKEDAINAKQKVKIMTAMYAKANEMGMAAGLEYLSEEGPAAVLTALDSVGQIDLFDPNNFEAAARAASKISGMNKETLLGVVTSMNMALGKARESAAALNNELKDVGPDALKSVKDIVGTYIDAAKGGKAIDFDKLTGDLKTYLSDSKIGGLIDQIKTNGYLVQEVLNGAAMNEATFKKAAKEQIAKPLLAMSGIGVDQRDKRIEELVKNTVSLDDIVGISKENATYLVAISDPMRAMANFAFATAQGVGNIYGLLAHWGDKSYKTNDQFLATDKGKSLTEAVEAWQYASARLEDAKQRGDKESQNKFQQQVNKFQDSIDILSKDRTDIVPQIKMLTQESAAKRANSDIGRLDNISRLTEDVPILQSKKVDLQKTGESTPQTVSEIAKIDAAISENKKQIALLKSQELAQSIFEGSSFSSLPAGPPIQTGPAPSSVAHDFMAMTAGYQNIKKGDLVIDSGSLAKGISAGSGQLIGKMGASANTGATTVTVPITLSVGSVNGDVDDMLKKITPAIEQSFTRMFFDRQKRK